MSSGYNFVCKKCVNEGFITYFNFYRLIHNNVYQAYCYNVVANIKPIYLNKHVFSPVPYKYKGKLYKSLTAKKVSIES